MFLTCEFVLQACRQVILIFSVKESGRFQGESNVSMHKRIVIDEM